TTGATTAANIAAALNAQFDTGSPNFSVSQLITGDNLNYIVNFQAVLANANVPAIVAAPTGATPATGVVVGTVRDGVGNTVQTLTFGGASGGTASITFNGQSPVGATNANESQLLTIVPNQLDGTRFTLSFFGVTTAP